MNFNFIVKGSATITNQHLVTKRLWRYIRMPCTMKDTEKKKRFTGLPLNTLNHGFPCWAATKPIITGSVGVSPDLLSYLCGTIGQQSRVPCPPHPRFVGSSGMGPRGSVKTTHIEDFRKQMIYSFEVVSKMIEQEGFMWADVMRATAYIKDKENLSILKDVLDSDLPYPVPLIITQNTICRDDLLFEIEVDLYS